MEYVISFILLLAIGLLIILLGLAGFVIGCTYYFECKVEEDNNEVHY